MRKDSKIFILVISILILLGTLIFLYIRFISPTNDVTTTEAKKNLNHIKEEVKQAIRDKNPIVYRNYIDSGEDLSFLLDDGKTVLNHLIDNNDIEYIEKIIDNGFSLQKIDTNRIDIISNIIASYDSTNPFYNNLVINLISQIENELTKVDTKGLSLLMNTIYVGNEIISLHLIELLEDVNQVYHEETALLWACQYFSESLNVIEALVEKGANINYQGKNDYTCLMYLVGSDATETLKYFVNLPNLDFNLVNDIGNTVLHECVDNLNFAALDILLTKSELIDFTIKNDDDLTAKEYALYLAEVNEDENYLEIANKL